MKMLRNLKLKLFLQRYVFSFMSRYNEWKGHDNKIVLFYINTEFKENNKALFDYMISNGYNNYYRIICSCTNPKDYCNVSIKNVIFTSRFKGLLYFFKAGFVFYSIGKIPIIPGKNQCVMQMWHGTPIKAANEGWKKGHVWERQHYTFLLAPSKHYAPIFSRLFSVPLNNIFIGGYPRCDALFYDNPNYDFGEYKKLVVWAPTFRKSINPDIKENSHSTTVIPILDRTQYLDFDRYLFKLGIKVIVKLHPAQSLEGFSFPKMSSFILMTHKEMVKKGIELYRLSVQSDALITDYSSIYFDYLLLNRPIAFTEDDMEEYGLELGFAVDNPDLYKPGARIKNKEDLMQFCDDLINDKDEYKEERKRVNELANDFRNGGYSQRILEKMGIGKQGN